MSEAAIPQEHQPPNAIIPVETDDFIEGYWDVSIQDYHNDRVCVSNSVLEAFRQSPALYHGMYVAKTIPRPESRSLAVGSAVHYALLEPHLYDDMVGVMPDVDRRTKEGKAIAEEFAKSSVGKLILSFDEGEAVKSMAASAAMNPAVQEIILGEGECERSVRWSDPRTGIRMRCRFDKIMKIGTIVDIKTSNSPYPSGWQRAILKYGYHRQAAIYIRGRAVVMPEINAPKHVHIVIGNSPPYDSFVYELDDEALEFGDNQVTETLDALKDSIEFDSWHGPYFGERFRISLPPWGFREE